MSEDIIQTELALERAEEESERLRREVDRLKAELKVKEAVLSEAGDWMEVAALWMNRFLAARKVALYYYSLDENGVAKSLSDEKIAALDAEIEAKLKEKTEQECVDVFRCNACGGQFPDMAKLKDHPECPAFKAP